MKKQELTINKSEAIEMYKTTCDDSLKTKLEKTFGIDAFVTPSLMPKLKNFKDVLKYNNITLEKLLPFKKPSNLRERKLNAESIWLLIVETFNEGWVEDFSDSNQDKYIPYGIYKNGSFSYHFYDLWFSRSFVGFGWGFKDYDTMMFCVNTFPTEFSNMLMAKQGKLK